MVGLGEVGEELPRAAGDGLEDAVEGGLLAEFDGEEECGVEGDPDG